MFDICLSDILVTVKSTFNYFNKNFVNQLKIISVKITKVKNFNSVQETLHYCSNVCMQLKTRK